MGRGRREGGSGDRGDDRRQTTTNQFAAATRRINGVTCSTRLMTDVCLLHHRPFKTSTFVTDIAASAARWCLQ